MLTPPPPEWYRSYPVPFSTPVLFSDHTAYVDLLGWNAMLPGLGSMDLHKFWRDGSFCFLLYDSGDGDDKTMSVSSWLVFHQFSRFLRVDVAPRARVDKSRCLLSLMRSEQVCAGLCWFVLVCAGLWSILHQAQVCGPPGLSELQGLRKGRGLQ